MTEAGMMTEDDRRCVGADVGVASAESADGPSTAQPAGGLSSANCIPSGADLARGYRDSTWSAMAEEFLFRVAVMAAFVFILNLWVDDSALWALLALPAIKMSTRLVVGWWFYRAGLASSPTNQEGQT